MIDVLYIIGPMSANYDLELKCSLRTLHRHVNDVGRIFITGRCPDFINQEKVTFTPCENESASKSINQWIKVQRTIDKTNIGEKFALMYDDIFFTKDIRKLESYPFYQKGKLGEDKSGGKDYQENLIKTKKWLEEHKQTTYDHELHVPCIYNREKFSAMKSIFKGLVKEKHPMAVRSVYANMFETYKPYKHDVKIRNAKDTKNENIISQECISASDYTFPFLAAPFIEPHIKERSPWEK